MANSPELPEKLTVTLYRSEALLIIQLLVAITQTDPKRDIAKSAFTSIIKAAQEAR